MLPQIIPPEFGEVFYGQDGQLVKSSERLSQAGVTFDLPNDDAPGTVEDYLDIAEELPGWAPVSGYADQYGNNGSIMRNSDSFGYQMRADVIDDDGAHHYAMVYVDGLALHQQVSDCDYSESLECPCTEPIPMGWVLLRKVGN